jgi:siroheme synthase
MLFARAAEELDYLRARGIRVEVVPGVTAALAAAAELGAPLTRRGAARSVLLVTPRTGAGERPNEWAKAAAAADTVAIYMGATEAGRVCRQLIAAGRPAATPAVLVENASLSGARCLLGTLAELERLAARATGGPALILLGEACRAAAASPIIGAWPSEPSSSSPTARAIPAGRNRCAR